MAFGHYNRLMALKQLAMHTERAVGTRRGWPLSMPLPLPTRRAVVALGGHVMSTSLTPVRAKTSGPMRPVSGELGAVSRAAGAQLQGKHRVRRRVASATPSVRLLAQWLMRFPAVGQGTCGKILVVCRSSRLHAWLRELPFSRSRHVAYPQYCRGGGEVAQTGSDWRPQRAADDWQRSAIFYLYKGVCSPGTARTFMF